jgi:uncharacterized protein (DUF58 family)
VGVVADLKRRLFRWRSDGTAPLRLSQRRIFILPTRAGLLFAAALLAMLTGAINYNLALGHALVFLLAGLALTGMVHTFRNLHGLVIAPGRSEPVFAGEVAYFPLHLASDRNRRAWRSNCAPATSPEASPLRSPPRPERSRRAGLAALRRGWLDLPRTRLATTYPLGLFVAWSYLQPAMRCLVYPQPLATPLPPRSRQPAAAITTATAGRRTFPVSANANPPTRRVTSPGKPAPAMPDNARCWSSSSPAAPRPNCNSTGR